MNLDDKITEHFTWREVVFSDHATRQGILNIPPEELMPNIMRQAQLMEDIRYAIGGRPIFITSWYRSPALNTIIGGAKDSAHMRGLACDFHCPMLGNPYQVAKYISESTQIHFDQLIHEFGQWVHIGLGEGDRMQLLTATKADGKTVYTLGLQEVKS